MFPSTSRFVFLDRLYWIYCLFFIPLSIFFTTYISSLLHEPVYIILSICYNVLLFIQMIVMTEYSKSHHLWYEKAKEYYQNYTSLSSFYLPTNIQSIDSIEEKNNSQIVYSESP